MTKNAAARKTAEKKPAASRKADPKVKAQLAALIAGTPSLAAVPPAPQAQPKPAAKKEPKAKPETKPSTVESPVALVHATCEKMTKADPKVARKDIMAALIAKGVNKFTASTQIQRWRSMQQGAKK